MTQAREHHFVPRFYLKQFSGNGASISLYNFARRLQVAGAPIKSQCARRQLHAFEPGLEDRFAKDEAVWAATMRAVIAAGRAPARGTSMYDDLLRFVVAQKNRTIRAGESALRLSEFFHKHVVEHASDEQRREADAALAETRAHPVRLPIEVGVRLPDEVTRLDAHLLHNNTPIDFITSDDPVVMHNQYCEGIDYRGVLGWNRVGIQVFFPLSPKIALMLFDPAVYKVDGTRHGERAMTVTALDDVHGLNSLQALNALENVFSRTADDGFEAFCLEMAARRPQSRQRFVESTPIEEPGGQMSMLLHSFESLLPTALTLEGIVLRKRARKVPLHARAGRARDGLPPRRAGGSFVRYPVAAMFDR